MGPPPPLLPGAEPRDPAWRWPGGLSLTRRILLVNIVALLLLAGGFFYLDSYRSRLVDARVAQAGREARVMAEALAAARPGEQGALLARFARETRSRMRLFDAAGRPLADSRALGVDNFRLIDPATEPWGQDVGRFIDGAVERVAGATPPPPFRARAAAFAWPTLAQVRRGGGPAAAVWRAPDRTAVVTAAAALPGGGGYLLSVNNERDITWTVRAERFRLSMVLLVVTLVSVLLSLFLARTIVRPIRRLARAAVRVRLGRAREVVVPRLPDRGDELGMLARALSDMSLALRARIDATEAFAADVTHELKNPLASLRSAVDALARVADPALRDQLLAIVGDDVRRLDRLITDIADASRLDAQLSRTRFEAVDLARLAGGLVAGRARRPDPRGVRVRFDHPGGGAAPVLGDGARLERVFENLLDNAVSFSPDRGTVSLALAREGEAVVVRVEDEGPGVPPASREAVFRRFVSMRPAGETFGRHSGLGLAIARTIVEGHQGEVFVESRDDRMGGARFVVRLPAAPPA